MARGPERVISWSEISSYRQCPHKHMLQYKQRWDRPNPADSALNKGTLMHKVLEVFYTSLMHGKTWAVAREDGLREIGDYRKLGIDRDVLDLIEWMFEGYVEFWAADANEWEVIGVEERFQIPIRNQTGRRTGYTLKGGIDLILKDRGTGRVFIVDHKTGANIPQDGGMDWEDQFALYLWALRASGRKVFGAIYNSIRTTRNKGDFPEIVEKWHLDKAAGLKPGAQPKPQPIEGRFKRIYMDRTPKELDTIVWEALDTARAAYSAANRHQRHPDGEKCKYRCSFTEACLTGRKMASPERETRFLLDTGFVQNFTRH